MGKAASPVRLEKELMEAATLAGARFHRSAAEQVEYWADLGRKVSRYLDPDDLVEVAVGLAFLRVEHAVGQPVDPDSVFETLEADRQTQALETAFTTQKDRYVMSAEHPGYLEHIDMNGHRRVGQFKDGIFQPLT